MIDQTPIVPPVKKHMRSFWPLVTIAVLAVLAGGLIVWSSFNSSLTDDISSMQFRVHRDKGSPTSQSNDMELTPENAAKLQQ